MATKSRPGRVELDIEKYRGEANWPRVLDLSRQLSQKSSSNNENLVKFVQCECKVERFLTENPPNETNTELMIKELRSEVQTMYDILSTNPQVSMKQEVMLLLGKVQYAMGEYDRVLETFNELNLENGVSLGEASSRKLKLIGEAFAIKGFCLEKQPTTSMTRYRQAEREDQIIQCFERSGDISLFQLQERLEKGTVKNAAALQGAGLWNAMADMDTIGVGPIVETAIQRSPILYIRTMSGSVSQSQESDSLPDDDPQLIWQRDLNKCIGRFRELLRAVETRSIQGLRQTLARQLAEVLLRGVCEKSYTPIDLTEPRADRAAPTTTLKPHKYTGDSLFLPKAETEETLLLLLISESIASREAVLNRSPELTDARLHTFHKTTAVYDLLTIALVKRAQFTMLSETFERAMRFSFDEFHIWYQFALSLICSEKDALCMTLLTNDHLHSIKSSKRLVKMAKRLVLQTLAKELPTQEYQRAYLVLKECMRLNPTDPVVYLQAAKLCYESINLISEGIEYCDRVLASTKSGSFAARAHLMLGIGYSLKADEVLLQAQRHSYQRKALEAFNRAVSLDSNDYLGYFHLAHQMALLRQIPDAIKHVRRAINLFSDHLNSHHLLALLLSAQKQYDEALIVVEAALSEYPLSFSLMFTKCKLLTQVSTVENALQTCRHMLQLWKDLYETTCDSNEGRGTGLLERVTTDHRSLLQLQLEVSDRDSGSVRAESVAASKIEHALSEVASSMGSCFQPKIGRQHTWMLQMQIWLLLAELYLSIDRFESAQACIQEASVLFPVSHVVSYMRGRYHEARNDLMEAKRLYESAIAINPSHTKSLHRLGVVQHLLGNSRLAEKVLRDAVTYDPTVCQCWQSLGKVLELLGDHEVAAECLITAVELEATSPIVSFSTIPKLFN